MEKRERESEEKLKTKKVPRDSAAKRDELIEIDDDELGMRSRGLFEDKSFDRDDHKEFSSSFMGD